MEMSTVKRLYIEYLKNVKRPQTLEVEVVKAKNVKAEESKK